MQTHIKNANRDLVCFFCFFLLAQCSVTQGLTNMIISIFVFCTTDKVSTLVKIICGVKVTMIATYPFMLDSAFKIHMHKM